MERNKKNKDIKCSWLLNLPNTWSTKKISQVFKQRKTKVSDKDFQPLSVTKNGILLQLANAAKSDDGDNRKLVKINDFVINSRSDRKSSCGVSKYEGSVSLINIVLEAICNINMSYINYLFRSYGFAEEFYRYGRGIVADLWTTRYSEMKNIMIPVPPRTEQDQIVRFLDWKISSINKQISLYKNKITSIEKLKFSAIRDMLFTSSKCRTYKNVQGEWFVKIPSNWNITKVKRHFKVMNGSDPTLNGDIPVYGSGSKSFKTCGEYKEPPAVLLGRKGTINKPQYINNKYWNVDTAFDVKLYKNDYNLKYFYYCSFYFNYDYYVTKTALPSMTQTDYKNIALPYPDLSEQNSIVSRIEIYEEKYNNSIAIVRKQLEVLKELKDKLIYDVVTGQISVQDVKIPKFEYFEENINEIIEDENIEETEE